MTVTTYVKNHFIYHYAVRKMIFYIGSDSHNYLNIEEYDALLWFREIVILRNFDTGFYLSRWYH